MVSRDSQYLAFESFAVGLGSETTSTSFAVAYLFFHVPTLNLTLWPVWSV